MMMKQVAKRFCRLREVHSRVYGRRTGGKNGGKLTAGTRVGSKSRLMDYPDLIILGSQKSCSALNMRHKYIYGYTL